jgi:hypothetical protein
MMAVVVKTRVTNRAGSKPFFEPGVPQPLFDAHLSRVSPLFQYDVTSDGKRLLVNTSVSNGAVSAPSLNVVVNWDAGLRR